MVYDTCDSIVLNNKMTNDYSNFEFELIRFSSSTSPFSKEEFENIIVKTKAQMELAKALFHSI